MRSRGGRRQGGEARGLDDGRSPGRPAGQRQCEHEGGRRQRTRHAAEEPPAPAAGARGQPLPVVFEALAQAERGAGIVGGRADDLDRAPLLVDERAKLGIGLHPGLDLRPAFGRERAIRQRGEVGELALVQGRPRFHGDPLT